MGSKVMPNKGLEDYDAAMLQTDFIAPLAQLVGDFTKQAERLRKLLEGGALGHSSLPLNAKMARKQIGELKRFLTTEVEGKIQAAEDGLNLWRSQARKEPAKRPRKKKS